MLNYTAIDFETANDYRGSPCAVGLVRVRDGVVVDERHWLVKPPAPVSWFSPFNVSIHGITAEMVANAPQWRDVLPAILEFIGGDVVVAHNAGFDIGVIRYACAVENIAWPSLRFLCTLVVARRAFRLPSYRLPFVTDHCGFTLTDHHDPLADARAVVGIVNHLAAREGVVDLEALAPLLGVRIGAMEAGIYQGSVCTATGNAGLVAAAANPDADTDGYLYGRVVVFTGALMSMTRQLAWDEVVRAGGFPEKNTTTRTNVLVLGDFNPANLRPGASYSGKARKAFDLQDKGQDIELMTEDDFLHVLEGHRLDELPADWLRANVSLRACAHDGRGSRRERFGPDVLAEVSVMADAVRAVNAPHRRARPPTVTAARAVQYERVYCAGGSPCVEESRIPGGGVLGR